MSPRVSCIGALSQSGRSVSVFASWGMRVWIALSAVAVVACGGSPLPTDATPGDGPPVGGGFAALNGCIAESEITALLEEAFQGSPDENAVLGKWDNIQKQVRDQGDTVTARGKVFTLVDFIRTKHAQTPLTISAENLVKLYNGLFCFVGIDANIGDPANFWIVYVGDSVTTFVTDDSLSGIQFPANAVLENTVVTARPADSTALVTLLDKYPFVYDWNLSPSQTLPLGVEATVGVCPSAASLAGVPEEDLAALLERLVLGHQSGGGFEVLERVPLPDGMVLQCGEVDAGAAQLSLGQRIMGFLADALLPVPAHAAAVGARAVGGVAGSTSEFSPFGPVDSELRSTGGVGGSTSEFLRAPALLESPVDGAIRGTVGTNRQNDSLPAVTITTYKGTPISGITVAFTTGAPATTTPVGDASVCGADALTDNSGTAAVTCLDFGTTVQYRTAYTKLSAAYTLPEALAGQDASGNPVVTVAPATLNWLVAASGPSTLVFTAPDSGSSFPAGTLVPNRVELRSDLGDIVPLAMDTVTFTLNQHAFLGEVTTLRAAANSGIAMVEARLPVADTGYRFIATARLADAAQPDTAVSAPFTIVPAAPALISVVGTADYGTLPPGANLVTPDPTVMVTDSFANPTVGATVHWTPGGATGALANGSANETTTTTLVGGLSSASWLLGEGDNLLRASLASAPGGAEVFFSARYSSSYSTVNACAPGGAKDAITDYYLVVPWPARNGGIFHSAGLYLSATGAVGQIDATVGYPMTLEASRTYVNEAGEQVTEVHTAEARAFLRGDNGASSVEDRLVTFVFGAIGPAPVLRGGQPDLTLRFVIPDGGYDRRINFNAGTCGPGRCRPPPECDVEEYQLPIGSSTKPYRLSTGLIIQGQ